MGDRLVRGVTLLLLSGLLLLPESSAQTQQQPTDPDNILVLGRKLKMVRITYVAFGSHLRNCVVTVSSHNPQVDQTMCALLRICLVQGQTGPYRARACINDHITRLSEGEESGESVDAMAARLMPSASKTPTPAPVPTEPAPPPPAADEIVVMAKKMLKPGLWHLTEIGEMHSSMNGDGHYAQQWRRCVPLKPSRSEWDNLLKAPSFGVQRYPVPDACYQWNVKVEGEALSGHMLCRLGTVHSKGNLTGSFGNDSIQVSRDRYWIASFDKAHLHMELLGQREGDCPGHHAQSSPSPASSPINPGGNSSIPAPASPKSGGASLPSR